MKHTEECINNLTVGAMDNVIVPLLKAWENDGFKSPMTIEQLKQLTKKGKKHEKA